ncbi:MAG: hypothetical protein ABGF52_00820 [Candidatus Asgardarchaeum sp.]
MSRGLWQVSIMILFLSILVMPLNVAAIKGDTNSPSDCIVINIPDPDSIVVPESYQEYHYVFYENHKTENGHSIWIRAYHVYVYGTYRWTKAEAEWKPFFGVTVKRWFKVYVDDQLVGNYYHNYPKSYEIVNFEIDVSEDGGNELYMWAKGTFSGWTGSPIIEVEGTCTTPPYY